MAGKFLSTALFGALVAGSFYFFGDVQAQSQAKIALVSPTTAETTSQN